MADIDLLVPDDHLEAAHRLIGQGAAEMSGGYADRHLGTIYMQGEAGVVEVHGTATHEALWPHSGDILARGKPKVIEGAPVILPDPANLWLHLASHGLSHAPNTWPRMAADLARIEALPGFNEAHWRSIREAALRAGCESMVLLAAAMAGGGRLPAGLREIGLLDADSPAVRTGARESWGIAVSAAVRDFRPRVQRWVDAGERRPNYLRAYLFPPLAVAKRRLPVPAPMAIALYPAYVLQRSVKLALNGLAWRSALRMRHLPGLEDVS